MPTTRSSVAETGKIDEADALAAGGELFAAFGAFADGIGPGGGMGGVVGVGGIGDDFDIGEEGGEGASGGGFTGAALAADEDAADGHVDGVEDEGALHALLADDGGEGVDLRCPAGHGPPASWSVGDGMMIADCWGVG